MDELTIIKAVEDFYNSAWEKLIISGTVAFAIIGIAIPLIVQWWQKREMSLKEKEIEQRLKEYLDLKTKELTLELKNQIAIDFVFKINQLEKHIHCVDGGAFHIQGNSNILRNEYPEALFDFYNAANHYIKGEDYQNLGRILGSINKSVLEKITKDVYASIIIKHGDILEMLINSVREKDGQNVFVDLLSDLKVKRHNLI